ncbi:MAG: magnesium chelatase [Bacteroidia bacterium]|nr:magnesium chelatase [Bacteroidia bacterium]
MQVADLTQIKTLGALREAGYQTRSIKDELRENLIYRLKHKLPVFQGIHGYEDTVIPDVERALLSRHNMILLGLRGQAKTRLARMMVGLLDEYIPVVEGADLNDDPFNPITHFAHELIAQKGDDTPIAWLHRDERYAEKLATPDVSVADLIGDVDPIKAANLRLSYADERVIHFGLVPRSNRSIFVINELPDLQARIQVALFNILQEGDIQIRGFKLRMPLDIQFVFTANPEDYTNRGSIVTPLKDRIESQILTHYPKTIEVSKVITRQEAHLAEAQKASVKLHELAHDLVEQIAVEARGSEYVDQNSGVSARLTISAYENLVSAAERRALINGETGTHIRVSDLWGVVPAITGKIELVYEGEQEGPSIVAQNLIGKAIRSLFPNYFPNPEKFKRSADQNPYTPISKWFSGGNSLDLLHNLSLEEYTKALFGVPGLESLVKKHHPQAGLPERLFLMEFVLHGMAEFSLISKNGLEAGLKFGDIISGMFSGGFDEEDLEEDDL